jgi:hypothetical protein
MKRVAAIAAIVDLLFLALALYTPIKDFLFVHQWLLSALATAPALVIAVLELLHSGEANKLRGEANNYRNEANAQSREANNQRERANEALAQIAAHTDAMRRSTDLQTIGLHQWVHIENWKAVPYIPEGGALSLHIQFDVVNSTALPLTLNNVSVMFACHGCSDQGGKIGRKNLVLPGKSHPVVTSVKITEEQALKWEDLKELVFIVNGSVEFEDALNEVRHQPFAGLIACSKKGGVRFIPPYGSGLYITDSEKKSGDPN